MIEFNNISKKFGKNVVLDGINFFINEGESVSILGRSGVGKTTIIRLMNGIENYDFGEIKISGEVLNKKNASKIRENIGYVFQDFNLFMNMNVIENITYKLIHIKKENNEKVIQKAEKLLNRFNIDKKIWHNYPNQISGGQKQRVAIIRSIIESPKILIMDEPTASLDLELCSDMIKFINEIRDSDRITMVTISHNLNFVEKISDKIMFISNGKKTDFVDTESFFHSDNAISSHALKFLIDCGWR